MNTKKTNDMNFKNNFLQMDKRGFRGTPLAGSQYVRTLGRSYCNPAHGGREPIIFYKI